MRIAVLVAVLLVALASRAAAPVRLFDLSVRIGGTVARGSVHTLAVLPGTRVTLEAIDAPGLTPSARADAGRLAPLGDGKWSWTAPQAPGLFPIRVVAGDRRDSLTLQAFVLVPTSHMRNERLNGYRIGRYPTFPLRGLAIYRRPAGFIEVTRANENALVSPHFRLKQFVCKQAGGYPKYVVLDAELLRKLEALLALANEAGYPATTFHVMSGYRTPAYNRAIGNVAYSRHTWGAAADIFIDEDADGRMDDLNNDGRSDVRDAELLYRLFDADVTGGMGKYAATQAHGPFVHIDVRDRRARW